MDSLKLPFRFDASILKAEIAQFEKSDYSDIYNPSVTLETLWLKHLIQPVGGPDDDAKFVPTESLKKCPHLLSVFETFQCRVETFRIHTLDAGAHIRPHQDTGYAFEMGKVRLHIPIQTNEKVKILLNGKPIHMQEGECWYCNFDIIHEVINHSEVGRIHLILDCMVNDWLTEVFHKAASGLLKA